MKISFLSKISVKNLFTVVSCLEYWKFSLLPPHNSNFMFFGVKRSRQDQF